MHPIELELQWGGTGHDNPHTPVLAAHPDFQRLKVLATDLARLQIFTPAVCHCLAVDGIRVSLGPPILQCRDIVQGIAKHPYECRVEHDHAVCVVVECQRHGTRVDDRAELRVVLADLVDVADKIENQATDQRCGQHRSHHAGHQVIPGDGLEQQPLHHGHRGLGDEQRQRHGHQPQDYFIGALQLQDYGAAHHTFIQRFKGTLRLPTRSNIDLSVAQKIDIRQSQTGSCT